MNQRRTGGGRGRRSSGPKGDAPRREHIPELHPTEEPPDIQSFAEWDLGPDILRGIAAMDIVKPTPIQALSIGPVLAGRDVIAKAQTGTGKTLAFGAPMMSKIDAARATVLGLVMCPTRELAQQVHGVLATLGLPRGVRVAMCVGGDPQQPQIAQLQAGAQVVVGTPGRILDLYQQRFLSFPWTEFVVLDEADKMFEIGFIDDIKKILSFTPEERQTLLFSATFPTEVLRLAREATRDPLEVATAVGTVTVDTVEQCYIPIEDDDRPMALVRILEQSGPKDVFLVFCARRTDVDRLMRNLERANLAIKALHGGYDQASRFRVMTAFRTGDVKALIATDVASRGLDVQHVTHVINFSVPRDGEDYAHRIGRTGRAGRSGIAITFVTPHEQRKWREILGQLKIDPVELDAPGRTGQRRRPSEDRPRETESAPREREARARTEERPRGEERPARDVRPARGGRPPRTERPARDDRPVREERPPPQDRPAREDRPAAAERARSEERPRREERPARAHRDERPARSETESRPAPAVGERSVRRDERAEPRRGQRERPARPPAEESRAREERPARTERPAQDDRPRRDESRVRDERPQGERARAGARFPRDERAPPPRTPEGNRPPGRADERPSTGERPRSDARPPVENRAPEPRPRSRRRRRNSSARPEVNRHDPDGLGRWGNRAEDFD